VFVLRRSGRSALGACSLQISAGAQTFSSHYFIAFQIEAIAARRPWIDPRIVIGILAKPFPIAADRRKKVGTFARFVVIEDEGVRRANGVGELIEEDRPELRLCRRVIEGACFDAMPPRLSDLPPRGCTDQRRDES
jgi:hypothetical protein